jgi:BirA family biotin operon repressor/biotin-[acetyl-CoA-carboxylase] ligase
MSDPLPDDLAAALRLSTARRGHLGEPTLYFREVSSTNEVAARLAEGGAGSGTMVVASAQTAGRGRLGRRWHSPPDAGLYVSLVIREAQAAPYLTLAGGVAVAQGIIAATSLPVQIKWPNDIIVPAGGRVSGHRKLAGVLAEASGGSAGIAHMVLGLGINLRAAAYPPEIRERATSIEAELGRPVDGWALLVETLASLAAHFRSVGVAQPERLLDAWRALAPSSQGTAVAFASPFGQVQGVTAGIDHTGALLVRVGGQVERVFAGEVAWQ